MLKKGTPVLPLRLSEMSFWRLPNPLYSYREAEESQGWAAFPDSLVRERLIAARSVFIVRYSSGEGPEAVPSLSSIYIVVDSSRWSGGRCLDGSQVFLPLLYSVIPMFRGSRAD